MVVHGANAEDLPEYESALDEQWDDLYDAPVVDPAADESQDT